MAVNPMIYEPQPVDENDNVMMCNSPYYAITFASPAITFTHIRLKLWVWSGGLTAPYVTQDEPTIILYKEKVNTTDTEITFEIADYVKDYIQPEYNYPSYNTNETVYVKYEWDVINNPSNLPEIVVSQTLTSNTLLGTLGWLWNYQGVENYLYSNNNSFGFYEPAMPKKKYDSRIIYQNYQYDLSGYYDGNQCLVKTGVFTPPTDQLVCSKEGFLIVYINKDGRWDYFTPTGKVTFSQKIQKEKYIKTFRNPLAVNPFTQHQVKQMNVDTRTEIVVNTGLLKEGEGQYIEEILYSPVVYLIEFTGDVNISNKYNSWLQRPVIVTDTDFVRRTRLNDKSKISYNIKFEETSNKISNVR